MTSCVPPARTKCCSPTVSAKVAPRHICTMNADLIWFVLNEVVSKWRERNEVSGCAKDRRDKQWMRAVIWFWFPWVRNISERLCEIYTRKKNPQNKRHIFTAKRSNKSWFALNSVCGMWGEWLTLSPLSPLVPAEPWNIKAQTQNKNIRLGPVWRKSPAHPFSQVPLKP